MTNCGKQSLRKPTSGYTQTMLTVQGDTYSSAARHRRAKILRGMVVPLSDEED